MKINYKKKIPFFIICCLLLALLAGCGKADSEPDSVVIPQEEPTEAFDNNTDWEKELQDYLETATLKETTNAVLHTGQKGNYMELHLQKGDTIKSLLDLAGIYEDSDLRLINQTQILHNQDVIVVPQVQSQLISINSASIDELKSLPGIGEMTALRIIEYRQIQSFQTLEDLMNVKGIGQKKFDALKGLICL